jgi:hypothetical protein
MDLLASAATTLLLCAIVRRLSDFTTGAVAAALYAALTMPGWLFRHDGFLERSVCETFIVVCVAVASWCAARWRAAAASPLSKESALRSGRLAYLWAVGVGFFGGAAVVFKPNAGLYLPAILLWMWLYRPPSIAMRVVVRVVVVAVVAAAIAPALTLLWLWRLDLLADARVAVLDFNRFYVSQGLTLKGYAVDFSKAIWLRMKTDPLWLAGGIGSLVVAWELVRRRAIDALAGLAVLWGSAAALVIVVNGARLFNTYFIQAFAHLLTRAAVDGERAFNIIHSEASAQGAKPEIQANEYFANKGDVKLYLYRKRAAQPGAAQAGTGSTPSGCHSQLRHVPSWRTRAVCVQCVSRDVPAAPPSPRSTPCHST